MTTVLIKAAPTESFTVLFLLSFQSTHTFELTLHLEQKVIKLKQDALQLMNITLVGTACGQILTLFKYAFGYLEIQESKKRGHELEELECHFKTDEESPDNEDTISKAEDEQDAAKQFKGAPPKSKKWHFGKCKDDLRGLVPISKAVPIILSTTIKLSETGVRHSYYSPWVGSEG